MKNLQNWLVGLSTSSSDEFIVRNVASLSKHFSPKSIHFVHIASKPEVPKEVLSDIPDLELPAPNHYRQSIEQLVLDNFEDSEQINIHVGEGNTITELLRKINNLGVDLAIVGKSPEEQGMLSKKIVRKSPCSILFIPLSNKPDIASIMVPTDFSEYAEMAVNHAIDIAEKYDRCNINLLHIYQDASKYLNKNFETYHEVEQALSKKNVINEKLSNYAQHKLDEAVGKFKSKYQNFLTHKIAIDRSKETPDAINEWVDDQNPDLVVIGSKGQSAAAAALLGNVSERIYSKNFNDYMLVVKKKDENISLVKALLGI